MSDFAECFAKVITLQYKLGISTLEVFLFISVDSDAVLITVVAEHLPVNHYSTITWLIRSIIISPRRELCAGLGLVWGIL